MVGSECDGDAHMQSDDPNNGSRSALPRDGETGAKAIAEMLDLVALSGYQADGHGLGPVQWRALRYFAAAEPGARTVTAFAEHHGSSKASASKTVSSMLRKGLLRRLENPNDSRNYSC